MKHTHTCPECGITSHCSSSQVGDTNVCDIQYGFYISTGQTELPCSPECHEAIQSKLDAEDCDVVPDEFDYDINNDPRD